MITDDSRNIETDYMSTSTSEWKIETGATEIISSRDILISLISIT